MSTRPDNSEAAYIWDALTEARNVGLFVADVAVSSGTSVTCFSSLPLNVSWKSSGRRYATCGESTKRPRSGYRTCTKPFEYAIFSFMEMHSRTA